MHCGYFNKHAVDPGRRSVSRVKNAEGIPTTDGADEHGWNLKIIIDIKGSGAGNAQQLRGASGQF